jgi:hypothetical protein
LPGSPGASISIGFNFKRGLRAICQ